MDRLFLDANVLFSAAYRQDASLRRLWELPGVALLTSEYALEEARRNLETEEQRVRLAELAADLELVALASVPSHLPERIRLPEKDRPILGAALAARATHLITGDRKAFGRYYGKRLLGLLVLKPAAYLRGR